MLTRWGVFAFVVLLCCAAAQSPARADALADARRAYDEGVLDQALTHYELALVQGPHEPAALAEIHFRRGVLQAALGQPAQAVTAFELALALDPKLPVPSMLDPARQESFEQARRARADKGALGLTLTLVAQAHHTRDTAFELRVQAAPAGCIAALVISFVPSEAHDPWSARLSDVSGESVAMLLPESAWHGARAGLLRAEAHDRHGNVLTRAQRRVESVDLPVQAPSLSMERAPVAPLAPVVPVDHAGARRRSARRWVWVGAAALLVTGTVLTTVLLVRAREDSTSYGRPEVQRD